MLDILHFLHSHNIFSTTIDLQLNNTSSIHILLNKQSGVIMADTHEVHLAIYDLSQGMARNLSAQLLGPQVC